MMTDGEGPYPEEAVDAIKNSVTFRQNKIKFTAIGYGNDAFDSLRRIASGLGGSMEKKVRPAELEDHFISLAANAYEVALEK